MYGLDPGSERALKKQKKQKTGETPNKVDILLFNSTVQMLIS